MNSPSVKQTAVVNATVGPFGPHEAAWSWIDQHTDHRITSHLQRAARNQFQLSAGIAVGRIRQNNEEMQ